MIVFYKVAEYKVNTQESAAVLYGNKEVNQENKPIHNCLKKNETTSWNKSKQGN